MEEDHNDQTRCTSRRCIPGGLRLPDSRRTAVLLLPPSCCEVRAEENPDDDDHGPARRVLSVSWNAASRDCRCVAALQALEYKSMI